VTSSSGTERALLVREARPQEWDAVGRLTLAAYEAAEILGGDPKYRAALLDAASRAQAPGAVLVAVDREGAILGAVAYCPSGSPCAEISAPDEAEFRMLAVNPAAQGAGVGRALVAACVERAQQDGLARLVLSVIDHNRTAAAMYQRLGFVPAPERDWQPGPGTILRVWTMELA
jgi:ribosomal protein S18 acetylase RimI-like enzyme